MIYIWWCRRKIKLWEMIHGALTNERKLKWKMLPILRRQAGSLPPGAASLDGIHPPDVRVTRFIMWPTHVLVD
jgi:hypothetical protein